MSTAGATPGSERQPSLQTRQCLIDEPDQICAGVLGPVELSRDHHPEGWPHLSRLGPGCCDRHMADGPARGAVVRMLESRSKRQTDAPPRRRLGSGLAVLLAALALAPAAWASTPYPPSFLPPLRQPQATPGDGVGIAVYGTQFFYVAWDGFRTNKVFYSAYGENCGHPKLTPCWTPQATVSGPWGQALTQNVPTLVDFNGDMYAFWAGSTTKKVFYSAYNGTTWSAQAALSGPWGTATTDATVALAVYNGDLYAAWAPCCASTSISYSYFNGSSWSSSETVPSLPSLRFVWPELVVYQSDLYLFWTGVPGGAGYSTYNGSTWSSPSPVAGSWGKAVFTTPGMGLAVCDGDLFAAWVNGASTAAQDIRYSDFDGTTWSKPVVVKGTRAALGAPVLATAHDYLYLAWGKYVFDKLGNLVRTRLLATYAENVGSPTPPLQ